MTVGDGEHPLQCPHAFWFSRRAPGKLQSSANYADNIKLVGKFASVSFLFPTIRLQKYVTKFEMKLIINICFTCLGM